MPSGVYIRPEGWTNNTSFKKGHNTWIKGKSFTKKTNCICVVCDKEFYRRPSQINAGIGYGKYCSYDCKGIGKRGQCPRKKINGKIVLLKGEEHPYWKGGIEPENKKIRKSREYRDWRKKVYVKCGFKCSCGSNKKLEAHHIKSFAKYPELRFDVSNGKLLCKKCHDGIRGGD